MLFSKGDLLALSIAVRSGLIEIYGCSIPLAQLAKIDTSEDLTRVARKG